jgi:aminoacrylate hydrolase
MTRKPDTGRLSIGDAELYYESHGEGPPLLLVPGLGGIGSFWSSQIAEFARKFRVIIHDHRGCGQSSRSRIAYSVDQMADDVLRLMDALKIEAAHFVGHSTGGTISQTIAQDRPERIRRLVLSASWAGQDSFFRRSFEMRKEVLRLGGTASYWRASMLWLRPGSWIGANEAALLEEEAKALADPPDSEILLSRIDAIIRFDRRARLGEIRAPTLVIVAEDDMITPRYMSEELAAKIPSARLAVLPYGGHFFPTIDPAGYNATVGAFLQAA